MQGHGDRELEDDRSVAGADEWGHGNLHRLVQQENERAYLELRANVRKATCLPAAPASAPAQAAPRSSAPTAPAPEDTAALVTPPGHQAATANSNAPSGLQC